MRFIDIRDGIKPSFDFNKNTPAKIFNKMNRIQKELLGFNFNPPVDEFERISTRTKIAQRPKLQTSEDEKIKYLYQL